MNICLHKLLLLVLLFLIPYFICFSEITNLNDSPKIIFTQIPECYTDGYLQGVVTGISDYTKYKIAIYINIEGLGWWTKPFYNSPCTNINSDGSWSCYTFYAPCDSSADRIAAFLLNANDECTVAEGYEVIPQSVQQNAITSEQITRYCCQKIFFGGYQWRIKGGKCKINPGSPNLNYFSCNNVWLEGDGMHFKISKDIEKNDWYCAEAILDSYLGGYGQYLFNLKGRLDLIDPNMIIGLFIYDDSVENINNREVDFEFSQWGDASASNNAQFVIQPFDAPGNRYQFPLILTDDENEITAILCWQKDLLKFGLYRGKYSAYPLKEKLIQYWEYNGSYLPLPGNERVRINFYLFRGDSPINNNGAEFVLTNFIYTPTCNFDTPIPKITIKEISEHLLNIAILPAEKLKEADINFDGIIDIADIILLINISLQ